MTSQSNPSILSWSNPLKRKKKKKTWKRERFVADPELRAPEQLWFYSQEEDLGLDKAWWKTSILKLSNTAAAKKGKSSHCFRAQHNELVWFSEDKNKMPSATACQTWAHGPEMIRDSTLVLSWSWPTWLLPSYFLGFLTHNWFKVTCLELQGFFSLVGIETWCKVTAKRHYLH